MIKKSKRGGKNNSYPIWHKGIRVQAHPGYVKECVSPTCAFMSIYEKALLL